MSETGFGSCDRCTRKDVSLAKVGDDWCCWYCFEQLWDGPKPTHSRYTLEELDELDKLATEFANAWGGCKPEDVLVRPFLKWLRGDNP